MMIERIGSHRIDSTRFLIAVSVITRDSRRWQLGVVDDGFMDDDRTGRTNERGGGETRDVRVGWMDRSRRIAKGFGSV